jgi:hypothetical protein
MLDHNDFKKSFSVDDPADVDALYRAYCIKTSWSPLSPPTCFFPTYDQGLGNTKRCFGMAFTDRTTADFHCIWHSVQSPFKTKSSRDAMRAALVPDASKERHALFLLSVRYQRSTLETGATASGQSCLLSESSMVAAEWPMLTA